MNKTGILQTLEAKLAPLEAERRRALLSAVALLLATPLWAYFLLLLFHTLGLGTGGGIWPLLVALPPSLALGLLASFRLRLKRALVTPLAEALGFTHRPFPGLSREEAEASGLLPRADRYGSEDLLEGKVGPFPFRSSDLTLYRRQRTKNGTRHVRILSGTLYRFALPFALPGEVHLAPQGVALQAGGAPRWAVLLFLGLFWGMLLLFLALGTLEGDASKVALAVGLLALLSLPFLLYGLGFAKPKERVVLESAAFERLFDVYGDQIQARKLLTPRAQEALVAFRHRLGRPFWARLGGNEAWFLIPGKDRFEPSLFQPLKEKTLHAYVEAWTRDLEEARRLLEAVGLDLQAQKRGLFGGEDLTQGPM
ncbi:DUF3137 domain-containing protein [Thermus sp. LT1-2-5]|uniref:DUF3137 domain-containing protein n=1 Tax=Thermus sp. LT1-2-5 TaxID=3026935 RepID=UPI0033657397